MSSESGGAAAAFKCSSKSSHSATVVNGERNTYDAAKREAMRFSNNSWMFAQHVNPITYCELRFSSQHRNSQYVLPKINLSFV